jgi:hypothetical protein
MFYPFASGQEDIVKDGLVLWLDAGDRTSYPGGGNVWRDLSNGGNNGTLINGPTFNSGNGGNIVFDGTNDYVNCGTNALLKFTTNFTLSVWLKFNTISGIQTIISNNESGGYGIISGLFSTRIETWYYISGDYYKAGEDRNNYNTTSWYNITSTFDGSNIIYYRNSNSIQTVSISGLVTTTSEPLIIGSNPQSSGSSFVDYFNGSIGSTQIYNRSLTQAEISQNFNATRTRFGV